MVEDLDISSRRTEARLKSIEGAIGSGRSTKEKILERMITQIAIDTDVAGGDLLQDLHTYGALRDKWKSEIDFTPYDNRLLDIITHPDKAGEYY